VIRGPVLPAVAIVFIKHSERRHSATPLVSPREFLRRCTAFKLVVSVEVEWRHAAAKRPSS
jgi:hypothetical protein